MTAVHEHMHQRTSKQQQERPSAKKVGAVFGQQKVSCNGAKHEQADSIA